MYDVCEYHLKTFCIIQLTGKWMDGHWWRRYLGRGN